MGIANQPLERDITSKALLSTDTNGLKAYRERKRVHVKMKDLDGELNNMKQDIADIKNLLLKLLENGNR